MPSMVAKPDAATSRDALGYFQQKMKYETDCADVHYAITHNLMDFVLLDVRAVEIAQQGFIEGAVIMPHATISSASLAHYPADTLFVVYCAGPHCNGTERAAIRLARLGRPVKKMIGGISGWRDEGFPLLASQGAQMD